MRCLISVGGRLSMRDAPCGTRRSAALVNPARRIPRMNPSRRLLVPHDFSDPANYALRFAADLVPSDGKLVVLHVVVPFVPITDIPPAGIGSYIAPDELVAGAKKQLDRMI